MGDRVQAGSKGVNTKGRTTRLFCAHDRSVPTACAATARLRRNPRYVCGELLRRTRSQSSWKWLRGGCPRGHRRRRARWTGWTDHCAHHLQGAPMRQADRHDRGRPRADQPRERQPPARPHPSRGDHLHHHHDSTTMRRCNVLCLHGASCSKCWLLLHEEDVLCIRCHAHVPLSTQKQPFKRERGDLMHGHGWPREGLSEASRAIAPGRQPRASTASPSAPKAGMLRM